MDFFDHEFYTDIFDDAVEGEDLLRRVVLDGICFAISHGYWQFAFSQAAQAQWWNIFNIIRVLFRDHPLTMDDLLSRMFPAYADHIRAYPHARVEVESLWHAYLGAPQCGDCSGPPN